MIDVFARIDIGKTEFWGSLSVAWMICFIIYCILFYAALLSLLCGCIYLLFHALKDSFQLRILIYLLFLYVLWLSFSFVHSVLVINNIASAGSDKTMANIARTLEIIVSSNFVSIIIVAATFLHQDDDSNDDSSKRFRYPTTYCILSTILVSLMTMIIIITGLFVPFESLVILAILIVFRSLMFIASVLMTISSLFYKHSFKTKELCCLLWRLRYIKLLVTTFSYFLLSYSYFLYMLGTLASNNDCIENVQLHRAVWLVFNSLLRICEVSFSIGLIYFVITRLFVKQIMTESKSKRNSFLKDSNPLQSLSFIPQKLQETKESIAFPEDNIQSAKPVEENHTSDLEDLERQQVQIHPIVKNPCEVEQLSHAQNSEGDLDKKDTGGQYVKFYRRHNQLSMSLPTQIHDVSQSENSISDQTSDSATTFDNGSRGTLFSIPDGKAITTC